MRVVVAPDKFKGTFTSSEVAAAIAAGIQAVRPDADIDVRPMADGGDGTLEVLRDAQGGRVVEQVVHGPHGERVTAPVLFLPDGRAVVEMATTASAGRGEGLLRPLEASSFGIGQLVAAAAKNASQVLVAVGGSLSTDGGTGAAAANGWRFVDHQGRTLPPGGGGLVRLDRIERPSRTLGARVRGLLDVSAPLLGPRGAAQTFGPQKGATDADVELLERGLERLAEVVRRELGSDVARMPGGGAGGGMGAGLSAFMDAELESGFAFLAEATRLRHRIEDADLVITGEGRSDAGSLAQKVPAGVARYARDAGVPCAAVVGANRLSDAEIAAMGLDLVVVAAPRGGLADAAGIEAATRDLVRRLT